MSSHSTSASSELVDARTKLNRVVEKTVTAANIESPKLMNDELNSDEMSDDEETIKERYFYVISTLLAISKMHFTLRCTFEFCNFRL